MDDEKLEKLLIDVTEAAGVSLVNEIRNAALLISLVNIMIYCETSGDASDARAGLVLLWQQVYGEELGRPETS